jgi:hypothetical protein
VVGKDWGGFVSAGDDWLFVYAVTCGPMTLGEHLHGPRMFAIGHATELYLKAAYLNSHPGATPQSLIGGFNHAIASLLAKCKKASPELLRDYELRPELLKRDDLFGGATRAMLEEGRNEYFSHFLRHQELYLAAKALQDLKYFGAYMPSLQGPFGFGHIAPKKRIVKLTAGGDYRSEEFGETLGA